MAPDDDPRERRNAVERCADAAYDATILGVDRDRILGEVEAAIVAAIADAADGS